MDPTLYLPAYEGGPSRPRKQTEKIVLWAEETQATCNASNDYCGVNWNATIIGHLLYNIATELGRDKSGSLVMAVLDGNYITALPSFDEFRGALIDACRANLGYFSAAECDAVEAAALENMGP